MLELVADRDTGEMVAADFDTFWLLYPRRVARKDAARAWARLTPAQQMAAIVGLVDWRRVWAKKDLEYVPHPATWLNGERWEDELPQVTVSASAHLPAQLPSSERGVMPAHVRELIAKLKNKC